MANLLSANLLRMRKSVLFWGLMLTMFALGTLMALNYYQMDQVEDFSLDGAFFTYPILACITTVVFIPLFFGQEYSDGTIRNKVTAGYPRLSIYAANLLTGMMASMLFCAAYIATVIAVGVPLVGLFELDVKLAVLMILSSLVTMAAFCALFTFISMSCSRKTLSAVICILGVFILLIASIYMRSRLEAPEYYTDYSLNMNGEPVSGDLVKNPQYINGIRRAAYEMLYNLLPTSQVVQYASQQTQNLLQMPLYSLATIILFTAIGLFLFQRKDLK